MKSITYTFGDWKVKVYNFGMVCISQLAMDKHRTYEFAPTGGDSVDSVETNNEYLYIRMNGDGNGVAEEFHLKLEGESGIVIDRWSPEGEFIDTFGCWDFIDDEDE
jgi:hypothetical protein